jgi:hypothetical protein
VARKVGADSRVAFPDVCLHDVCLFGLLVKGTHLYVCVGGWVLGGF